MNVLVIGGGAREHALAWALKKSPLVTSLHATPGNAGIAGVAELYRLAAEDVGGIVALAKREAFNLVVVGPELPLTLGLADQLAAAHIPVFGCSRAASAIEASKSFAKDLMARHKIPTAESTSFSRTSEPLKGMDSPATDASLGGAFIEKLLARDGRVVIKADGLASGKGVAICEHQAEALAAFNGFLDGGSARVVVEAFLVGREVSCMALVSAERVWLLPPCEDHKTISDGDKGAMTGGMGAVSPTPVVGEAMLERIRTEILEPTARALLAERRPFRGLLYAGLMITAEGPKVLEFNARFGDPEAQALVVRWKSDVAQALHAIATGGEPVLEFDDGASCSVVLAARGYPGAVAKGAVIKGVEKAEAEGAVVFHGGTRRFGEDLLVDGGRVLSVTATGTDLADARARAYRAADRIRFDGMQLRRDIGNRTAD